MAEGKPLVGVDIGATSIKVCQLKEGRKGSLGLLRFGFCALEPQTIVDRHIMNSGAVVDALQTTFANAKIRQKEVALSVSGQSVISRKITVPIMTTAELDEQIQWEAENHIPFDIKDVNVDYEILRRRPEAGQMDLLLVAAKRDEIEAYYHRLASPFRTAEKFGILDVIDPRETRSILCDWIEDAYEVLQATRPAGRAQP